MSAISWLSLPSWGIAEFPHNIDLRAAKGIGKAAFPRGLLFLSKVSFHYTDPPGVGFATEPFLISSEGVHGQFENSNQDLCSFLRWPRKGTWTEAPKSCGCRRPGTPRATMITSTFTDNDNSNRTRQ